MAAEDITQTYTYEQTSEIDVLEMDTQAAGIDVITDPVRVTADSDEWNALLLIDDWVAATLALTVQESPDYDPNVHATPADAHWYDTVQIGTATAPIATIGEGAYTAYHRAPLGRYARTKYTLVGKADFALILVPKSRQVNPNG